MVPWEVKVIDLIIVAGFKAMREIIVKDFPSPI
jgi:hypothetical protein